MTKNYRVRPTEPKFILSLWQMALIFGLLIAGATLAVISWFIRFAP